VLAKRLLLWLLEELYLLLFQPIADIVKVAYAKADQHAVAFRKPLLLGWVQRNNSAPVREFNPVL
jgi:hypothetical protein